MNNSPDSNVALPKTLSGDIIVLILFLFIGIIMLVVYLSPSSFVTSGSQATPLPTLSHPSTFEMAPSDQMAFIDPLYAFTLE
jgi:hypothetical protein